MPKSAKCPNPNCDSHEFESSPMQNLIPNQPVYIIQCQKCGHPIGVVSDLYQIRNTLRNTGTKIGATVTL
jgi:ribosomal protein S14